MESSTTQSKNRSIDEVCLKETAREKYWTELSIEEKLERTRQVVKQVLVPLQHEVERLTEHCYRLEAKFNDHNHNGNEVYVKANSNGASRTMGIIGDINRSTNNDLYF